MYSEKPSEKRPKKVEYELKAPNYESDALKKDSVRQERANRFKNHYRDSSC
jgi:hypothetical protein